STVISLPTKQNRNFSNDLPNQQINSYPIDQINNEEYEKNIYTQIKLSLPENSSRNIFYPHRNTISHCETTQEFFNEEFLLPTNPPITVTIEPQQLDLNENILKNNSLIQDDQICSTTNTNKTQRSSIDTTIKPTSTIVNYFMDLLKPSDNKLAMKLFGSRKGLLKERLRQQRAGHCIIHPCSNF
ncbi:unnamed protein product, partial [Adineta ricciae]